MLLYALRRLIYLVPVAFGVSLLVFALVHLAPGDPISAIVPPDAPQEVVEKLKEYYGFDKPLPIQYLRWLGVTLTGDFGTSIGTGRPVATEVMSAFGNTIILAISATLLAFTLAVILGTAAAYAKSRIVDRLVTLISLMGVHLLGRARRLAADGDRAGELDRLAPRRSPPRPHGLADHRAVGDPARRRHAHRALDDQGDPQHGVRHHAAGQGHA